jgi:hypothetical protein
MDVSSLRQWLGEPHLALIAAIAENVRAHVATLRARGVGFYGYALLPGEPYDIHSIVAVVKTETDISVPPDDDQYRYYRYSVDEWAHWDHDSFETSNKLLVESNERFKSMHTKADDDYQMDEFEIVHANALLEAVVCGLKTAKQAGAFGNANPFLAVWISGSDCEIMVKSVQRLNSAAVAAEFEATFG